MYYEKIIKSQPFILGEGALLERLRKEFHIKDDPNVTHATCIYNEDQKKFLTKIYKQYLDIGFKYNLPMYVLTATWRANQERIKLSNLANKNINEDNVKYLRSLCKTYGSYADKILVGGTIGPKGDAYNPNEGLDEDTAYDFHSYQIDELSKAGVDFIIARTLPNIKEALGIAKKMSETKTPYVISFVIYPNGTLLDGTSIHEAITAIDSKIFPAPINYEVNCVHPSIFKEALNQKINQTALVKTRLIGIQANTSSKTPEELDGLKVIDSEEPELFGRSMIDLYKNYGIKILAGCCGSDNRHIEEIAKQYIELKDK